MLMCNIPVLTPLPENEEMLGYIDFNPTEKLCHFFNCQHLDASGIATGGKRSSFCGCTEKVKEDWNELF